MSETRKAHEAPHLLLVDDDERLRTRLLQALRDRGLEVEGAGSLTEAIDRMAAGRWTHAIVDLRLPDGSGIDVVKALKRQHPELRVVMITGYGSIPTAVESAHAGVVHYLTKPASVDELCAALDLVGAAAEPTATESFRVPSLARVEWEHIQRVLAECDGNVSQAAKLLGMHRRSLQRRLQKTPGKDPS